MQGVVARRNNFTEPILEFFEDAYKVFGALTGRCYGLVSRYRTDDAETVFVSLGSAAENIEAAVDYLRERRQARVGSIHINVGRRPGADPASRHRVEPDAGDERDGRLPHVAPGARVLPP